MHTCVVCGFVAVNDQEVIGHLKAHPTEYCPSCKRSWFANMPEDHGKPGSIPCGIKREFCCMFCKFQTFDIRAHAYTHLKPFSCDLCPYTASSNSLLVTHQKHHTAHSSWIFKCPKCSFADKTVHQLKLHMVFHEKRKVVEENQPSAKRQKVEETQDGFAVLEAPFPRPGLSEAKDTHLSAPQNLNECATIPPLANISARFFTNKLADFYQMSDGRLIASMHDVTVIVGRKTNYAHTHIVLQNPTVSRTHLMIRLVVDKVSKKAKLIAKNFGTNGSYIDANFITHSAVFVKDRAVIQCGKAISERFYVVINPIGLEEAGARLLKSYENEMERQQAAYDAVCQ